MTDANTSMNAVWTEQKLDQLAEAAQVPGHKLNLSMGLKNKDFFIVDGESRAEQKGYKRAVAKALEGAAFADMPKLDVKGAETNGIANYYDRSAKHPSIQPWLQHRATLSSEAGVDVSMIRVEMAMIDGSSRAVLCVSGADDREERDNLAKVAKAANAMVIEESMPRPTFVPCSKVNAHALVAA